MVRVRQATELGWRPFGLTQAPAQDPPTAPPAQVKRGFPEGSQLPRTPTNSHLVQLRLTKSREFSGRPTRGNSRIEGTRPVRSGLRPPPSSLANLYRDETRAGFPYSFRGFAEVGCNTRRAGSAERAALSVPVSDLDFRGERLRRPSGVAIPHVVEARGQLFGSYARVLRLHLDELRAAGLLGSGRMERTDLLARWGYCPSSAAPPSGESVEARRLGSQGPMARPGAPPLGSPYGPNCIRSPEEALRPDLLQRERRAPLHPSTCSLDHGIARIDDVAQMV